MSISPSQLLNNLSLEACFGEKIDFANARRRDGATLSFSASLRPTDHVALGCS